MTIKVNQIHSTSRVAVRIKLNGGYKLVNTSWSQHLTPAQKAQQDFFNRQMSR